MNSESAVKHRHASLFDASHPAEPTIAPAGVALGTPTDGEHDPRESSKQLRRILDIHADLARLALDGAGLPALAAKLAQHVENPVVIENRFFRRLAHAGAETEPTSLGEDQPRDAGVWTLWHQLQHEAEPVLVTVTSRAGASELRIVCPIVVSRAVVGYLSIVERDHSLGTDDFLVARQAALALGIEFARHWATVETELRLANDSFDVVLATSDSEDEVQAIRSALLAYDLAAPQSLLILGIDPEVVALEPGPPTPTPSDLAEALRSWLHQSYPRNLLAVRDDQVVVLVSGVIGISSPCSSPIAADSAQPSRAGRRADSSIDPATAQLVADFRRAAAAAFPTVSLSIAVAPPLGDLHELRRTYDVTRRALQALGLLGDRGQTISAVDPRLAIFLLLNGTRPDAPGEFVDLVLGALQSYDAQHSRTLVVTLEAYLASAGQIEGTARSLNVHPSTLKYRLRRIEEVGGLDLRNPDHRFNAALALRLRALAARPS